MYSWAARRSGRFSLTMMHSAHVHMYASTSSDHCFSMRFHFAVAEHLEHVRKTVSSSSGAMVEESALPVDIAATISCVA